MKRSLRLACLLCALCAAGAHAELYKWVGPDGKISYSDMPPPPSATRVETRAVAAGEAGGADLPYELAQAAKSNPVVLYSTANCLPCDDGRRLLTERGVPFVEKTVASNEDAIQFRKLAGADARFPYLTVGRDAQRGFEPGAWHAALSAAGYPEHSMLPKDYRNPPPQALAPAPKPMVAKQDKPAAARADTTSSGELPPPAGNAPPGFRF